MPVFQHSASFRRLSAQELEAWRDAEAAPVSDCLNRAQAMDAGISPLSPSMHDHPEEQWGLCLEGSGIRFQGGEEIAFSKGDFWRTPGGVPHTMRAGEDGCRVLDIFAPPRDEYRKPGSGFGNG